MSKLSVDVSRDELASLCERHHVRELALFGSSVRKDFSPESDIDVLVEFEPQAQVGFVALARLQRELSTLFRRRVDLVPKSGLKPPLRNSILSSAKVLYAS